MNTDDFKGWDTWICECHEYYCHPLSDEECPDCGCRRLALPTEDAQVKALKKEVEQLKAVIAEDDAKDEEHTARHLAECRKIRHLKDIELRSFAADVRRDLLDLLRCDGAQGLRALLAKIDERFGWTSALAAYVELDPVSEWIEKHSKWLEEQHQYGKRSGGWMLIDPWGGDEGLVKISDDRDDLESLQHTLGKFRDVTDWDIRWIGTEF